MHGWASRSVAIASLWVAFAPQQPARVSATPLPAPIALASGWLMQDEANVDAAADRIASVGFSPDIYVPHPYVAPATASANPPTDPGKNGAARPLRSSGWTQAPAPLSRAWYRATVPGTVLTTLVDNGVYPEPLYGENNRPNIIPESLCRTSYWYRTEIDVPASYDRRRVWLTFDGINYVADVWVNGWKVGDIRGAFARGQFDITSSVAPGQRAAIAVLIHPPPTPADPLEQTQLWGMGLNGGVHSHDGPTFVASQGWDWMPAIRDRNMGIWQKVTLSASGPAVLRDPYVVTELPLPRTDTADVSIAVAVANVTSVPVTGVVEGTLGDIAFQSAPVTIGPAGTQTVTLSPANTAQLRLSHPKLWWPNGFGDPNLYPLHLTFAEGGIISDAMDLKIGVRSISYKLGDRDDLALVVNGVPVFAKGGNWGMDEAMKRIPRERLDAEMRLHRDANYTIVRNWVGQSTSEDFYDLADRYGLLVWDEFFQPAAGLDSGRERGETGEQDLSDISLYLANVREKVLRFRNHPSIALWCGRNEGAPSPKFMADRLVEIMAELDPARAFQPDSDAGRGVRSGGPYWWQPPASYYAEGRGAPLTPFKTEIGSVSIPTLEAIHAMMPAADTEPFPNDDWAEHDFATGGGNNHSAQYLTMLASRYGDISTLPRFVRAAQMANYEAYRALYEGRFAKLFKPSNAVITWMSNPAQPSLTWQIYSYDLEPFASFFAVKVACEQMHIQMNQTDFHVVVVNHMLWWLDQTMKFRLRVVTADGRTVLDQTQNVEGPPRSAATDLGAIPFPSDLSGVHFVKLELWNSAGRKMSDNTYWRNAAAPDDLTALNALPMVTLDAEVTRHDAAGAVLIDVTLANPSSQVALLAHVQLRNQRTNLRVLPVFYSDNYVTLLPGERRTITIEAAAKDLGNDRPLVTLDGWNVTTAARDLVGARGVSIAPNLAAIVVR
ncbi:MAG TPA: glycoside hydrolase family 2 TIM barrel-domain containing protein [Vicinamibacterales bacterium]|nr:glycoside hydrolase family 2 TIM barrel-domain containing protein [Vicinamibacterales bacterium]